MKRMSKVFSVLVLVCVLAWPQRPVLACTVCLSLPEHSLSDRLISAEVIALAAPSPDNPFRYTPVRLLKGSWEDIGRLPEIPFLIDSTTRRMFRADPDSVALMIYGAGSLDKAGRGLGHSWTKGFLMTPLRFAFVDSVLKQGKFWNIDGSLSRSRAGFFVEYLRAGDDLLRNTAMVELHRVPYASVRHLHDNASTPDLLRELQSLNRIAYAPAAIRLLGLQTDPVAAKAVRSVYPNSLATGGLNLREWALAGIEVDGEHAVASIDQALGAKTTREADRRAMIDALIDGGSAIPQYRARILGIFNRVIQADSTVAGQIALATRDWGNASLHPTLRTLLSDPATEPATAFAIRAVLPTEN